MNNTNSIENETISLIADSKAGSKIQVLILTGFICRDLHDRVNH